MTDDEPTCDYCGLPAICVGAELARPTRLRCPIHCRENPQMGGEHGRDTYDAHILAEGYDE